MASFKNWVREIFGFVQQIEGALHLAVEPKYLFKTILQNSYIRGRKFGARSMIDINTDSILACGSTGIYVIDKNTWTYSNWDTSSPSYEYVQSEQLALLKITIKRYGLVVSLILSIILRPNQYNLHLTYNPSTRNDPLMHWVLFEDSDHTMWVGHDAGLSTLNLSKTRNK